MSVMRFVRTYQRMEEDDPIFFYHDRVCCTGQTRQETYSRPEAVELRDQLDEILGDREDYKALCRDHAIMAQALSENEAAARVLGIVEGDDFLLTIAQWAKSYREPELSPDPPEHLENTILSVITDEWLDGESAVEIGCDEALLLAHKIAKRVQGAAQPSPDLKEALGRALRTWRASVGPAHLDGKGEFLIELLASAFQAERDSTGVVREAALGQLDRLADHIAAAVAPVLPALTSEEATAVRACADVASAWAPSRTTSAGAHLVEQARIARAAAERLSGAGAAESDADPEAAEGRGSPLCARCGHPQDAHDGDECLYGLPDFECLCEGFIKDQNGAVTREQWERDTLAKAMVDFKARLDKLESLYLPVLDERVTRLERHAGEAQHALGTDGGEIGLHREQIGDITKRIEEIGLEIHGLQNWRRSCAHRPADAEALAALVDAAVERALGPYREALDERVGDFARSVSDIADLGLMHERLEGRVQALELHRAGLTDGQAEAAVNGSPEDLDERLLAVYLEEVSDSPLSDEGRHHALKMLRDVADAETLEAARGRLDGWVPARRQKMIAAKIWGAAGV